MEIWQNKIRILRKQVRGWANNVVAEMNKHKQEVYMEYNWLGEEAEHRDLDVSERERMRVLAKELDKFWSLKKIKARQSARDKQILEGDRNTAYFHTVVKHRK
jgi:hypothetical protein